jgi:hypothetical protein
MMASVHDDADRPPEANVRFRRRKEWLVWGMVTRILGN